MDKNFDKEDECEDFLDKSLIEIGTNTHLNILYYTLIVLILLLFAWIFICMMTSTAPVEVLNRIISKEFQLQLVTNK